MATKFRSDGTVSLSSCQNGWSIQVLYLVHLSYFVHPKWIIVAVSSDSVPSGFCPSEMPPARPPHYDNSIVRYTYTHNLDPSSLIHYIFSEYRCAAMTIIIPLLGLLGVSSHQLMVLMGQVLSRNLTSSSESQPGKMLNVIWPYLSRKEDVDSYLACVESWMPYLLRHWRVSFEHSHIFTKMIGSVSRLIHSRLLKLRRRRLRLKKSTGLLTTLSSISGPKLKPTMSLN